MKPITDILALVKLISFNINKLQSGTVIAFTLNMMIHKNRKGFSIIEMLIAITILAISLLAIIPLLITSISTSTETSLASKAQMLGAELVSQIQTWPEDDGNPTAGNDILNSGCLDMGSGTTCTWDTINYKGTTLMRGYRIDRVFSNDSKTNYMITVHVSYTYKGQTITRFFTGPWVRQ
ncbi:MAG: prepilin-type N-terminal cleavage/methylation domain-containing protein [Nitrospirae bacterium]|nr:MAG: prepilin-type N-terminal cleavage/methylation domain-containing protein [Nitrospirota bacterium]